MTELYVKYIISYNKGDFKDTYMYALYEKKALDYDNNVYCTMNKYIIKYIYAMTFLHLFFFSSKTTFSLDKNLSYTFLHSIYSIITLLCTWIRTVLFG